MKVTRDMHAAVLALTLAACGGGGDDGSKPTVPGGPGPQGPVSSAGTLQTNVAPATYAAGSMGLSAYSALNEARSNAGAGVVAQSSQLDAAAGGHAAYLTAGMYGGSLHLEDPTKPMYFEATPASRIAKAGFDAGFATEVIGGTG